MTPRIPRSILAAAHRHDDVLSRSQLRDLGVCCHGVARAVDQARWQSLGPTAVVLHNGPLTPRQRQHVALLNAGPQAALSAWTALEVDGLTGWGRPVIHLLVPRGLTPAWRAAGVKVHESRRFHPELHAHPARVPRRTSPARSAIDAATWSNNPRTAVGVLAAVVQQRLARPEELMAELEGAGRIRYLRLLTRAVADIAGGAQALSEIDFGRLCRRFGLPEPERQQVRRDSEGRRRYLDAAWRRPDGRRVVAEVDGALHLLPAQYWDDMARDNDLTLDGDIVLRFPAFVFRVHPARVAAQVARALGLPPPSPVRSTRREATAWT